MFAVYCFDRKTISLPVKKKKHTHRVLATRRSWVAYWMSRVGVTVNLLIARDIDRVRDRAYEIAPRHTRQSCIRVCVILMHLSGRARERERSAGASGLHGDLCCCGRHARSRRFIPALISPPPSESLVGLLFRHPAFQRRRRLRRARLARHAREQ